MVICIHLDVTFVSVVDQVGLENIPQERYKMLEWFYLNRETVTNE